MKTARKMVHLGRWGLSIFIASTVLAGMQELALYIYHALAGYDEMTLTHHFFYGLAASFSSGAVFTFTGAWMMGTRERVGAAKIFAVAFVCMAFFRMAEAGLHGDEQGVPLIFIAAAGCAGMFGAFGTWYVMNSNENLSLQLTEGS